MGAYEYYLDHDLVEYEGKWIAIKDEEVVASCDDFNTLTAELASKELKINEVLITNVPRKDTALAYTTC